MSLASLQFDRTPPSTNTSVLPLSMVDASPACITFAELLGGASVAVPAQECRDSNAPIGISLSSEDEMATEAKLKADLKLETSKDCATILTPDSKEVFSKFTRSLSLSEASMASAVEQSIPLSLNFVEVDGGNEPGFEAHPQLFDLENENVEQGIDAKKCTKVSLQEDLKALAETLKKNSETTFDSELPCEAESNFQSCSRLLKTVRGKDLSSQELMQPKAISEYTAQLAQGQSKDPSSEHLQDFFAKAEVVDAGADQSIEIKKDGALVDEVPVIGNTLIFKDEARLPMEEEVHSDDLVRDDFKTKQSHPPSGQSVALEGESLLAAIPLNGINASEVIIERLHARTPEIRKSTVATASAVDHESASALLLSSSEAHPISDIVGTEPATIGNMQSENIREDAAFNANEFDVAKALDVGGAGYETDSGNLSEAPMLHHNPFTSGLGNKGLESNSELTMNVPQLNTTSTFSAIQATHSQVDMPAASIAQGQTTQYHSADVLAELRPTVLQHLAYLEAHRPATVAIALKLDDGESVEMTLKLTQSGKLQVNFGSDSASYKTDLQEGWRGLASTIADRGWVLDGPHFEGVATRQDMGTLANERASLANGSKSYQSQSQASVYAVHTSPLARQPGSKPAARLRMGDFSEALSSQFA